MINGQAWMHAFPEQKDVMSDETAIMAPERAARSAFDRLRRNARDHRG
jgi:hypothetical protein